mmetsp:Transcript_108003/g.301164  ORF Transcript_108003/g.301164 Transcript_108003/m.301164 type:complete len:204 (-) Transcript_108003:673-1284(-)
MSRNCSNAASTSCDDQQEPSNPSTAFNAAACSPRSMPVTRSFRMKWACCSSERCSSSAICASSSMLRASKYSRIASRSSVRSCRASPEPQTLRECSGVRRCTLRTTSTPLAPPKRRRRALFRNSAGSNSRSTAALSNATSISRAPGRSFSNCPMLPNILEIPICTSASSNNHSACGPWSCTSRPSASPRFSAARPSASTQAVQ